MDARSCVCECEPFTNGNENNNVVDLASYRAFASTELAIAT